MRKGRRRKKRTKRKGGNKRIFGGKIKDCKKGRRVKKQPACGANKAKINRWHVHIHARR